MDLIEIFKALGDETRIRIMNLLLQGEFCVCEIEEILGITQSNASRHLNRLRNAGIIDFTKRAQWVYYKIDEVFLEKNQLLYNYLNKELAKNYQEDLKMLEIHRKDCDLCLSDINE